MKKHDLIKSQNSYNIWLHNIGSNNIISYIIYTCLLNGSLYKFINYRKQYKYKCIFNPIK